MGKTGRWRRKKDKPGGGVEKKGRAGRPDIAERPFTQCEGVEALSSGAYLPARRFNVDVSLLDFYSSLINYQYQ